MPSRSPIPELDAAPLQEPAPTPSFERLYELYAAFTWRALRHLGLSASAVEDAVQELWVVVHRRLPSFEARSSVESWLFGIAINVARNQRRGWRRHPSAEPLADGLPDRPDTSQGDERREAFELVQRYLETLDDLRREIFVCHLLEGMSAPETAAAVGVPLALVQNRIRALRRSFKTWLVRGSSK